MSQRIHLFPMCDIGMTAPECHLMLFRDELQDVRAVAVNEVLLPRALEAKTMRFIYVDETRVARGIATTPEQAADELILVATVSRATGLITAVFDAALRRRYTFIRMDANWPNVLTVYTFRNTVVAVEDLPHLGLQPIVVTVTDRNDERIWRGAVHAAGLLHVVVVMHSPSNRVLEVYVPLYDHQIPASQRVGTHQRVAFIQRAELLLNRDRSMSMLPGAFLASRPHEFKRTAAASSAATTTTTTTTVNWSAPVTAHTYSQTADGDWVVSLWRERTCCGGGGGATIREAAMMHPLVFDAANSKLYFGGYKRRYPLDGGGHATSSWFFMDPLEAQVGGGGTTAFDLVDAGRVAIAGARNTLQIAQSTRDVLAPFVDLNVLISSTLTVPLDDDHPRRSTEEAASH